jgi:hypothetical protein
MWEPSMGTSHRLPIPVSKQQLDKHNCEGIPPTEIYEGSIVGPVCSCSVNSKFSSASTSGSHVSNGCVGIK